MKSVARQFALFFLGSAIGLVLYNWWQHGELIWDVRQIVMAVLIAGFFTYANVSR
jgi:hypothetical protein